MSNCWNECFSEFMNLLNRSSLKDGFRVDEIISKAEQLKINFPIKAEPYFFLARMYRNIHKYLEARRELDIIYSKNDWDTPEWILSGETKFEESLISYFYKNNPIEALRFNISYLNEIECKNELYALENLVFLCSPLSKKGEIKKMNLPQLGTYHPSSVNFLDISGEDCLCVRYVNYKIRDNGCYDLSEFSTCNMIIYKNSMEIIENNILLPKYNTLYHGIEDVRLYRDISGQIHFVGTQQEWVPSDNVNRIIHGKLELNSFTFRDAQILEPPIYTECEKNWIPWINSKDSASAGAVKFIYWWYPFQMGVIGEDNKLKIIKKQEVPPIFASFRGSSNIVYLKSTEEFWAVVHFVHTPIYSEGTRRYYHCIVIFKETDDGLLDVIDYTLPFTFMNTTGIRAIEYCLGLKINEQTQTGTFWFSLMDNEPHRLDIHLSELQQLRQGNITSKSS